MSSFTDALREIIYNPDSSEAEKSEATASLKRLAEAGGEDARKVLTDLGLLAPDASPYTIANAKAVINDPSSTPQQREAAWVKLKTPEDVPAETRKLERELLEETSCASITDVNYQDVHKFCTEQEWKNPAVVALFERWLHAYWKTEQGSRKLAEAETYALMHKLSDQRGDNDSAAMGFLAELRRRIRADETFCEMLAQGIAKNEIPIEWIDVICGDLWKDPAPPEQAVTA